MAAFRTSLLSHCRAVHPSKKAGKVSCLYSDQGKKEVKCNDTPYARLSEHIGEFPLVLITPYDTDLIREGSEERRRFFDAMLCQLSQEYLQRLMRYNHALRQRNELLKLFAERNKLDRDLLASYDRVVVPEAQYLARERSHFVQAFRASLVENYALLAGELEEVSLEHESKVLDEQFAKRFDQSLEKDLALRRTHLGAHRDDFLFNLKGQSIKRIGSQGQQKSYVIALKLAQYSLMTQIKGYQPLLLLDDIFDRLDDLRISRLVKLVSGAA
ncbi:MAG: DNA replication and repair protein RecF, partial [Cytophagales bacterium]|nr:DNA replication and repair protein RecF [Cytophagales bacterium]